MATETVWAEDGDGHLLERVEAELRRPRSKIAFGPEIEALYQGVCEPARIQRYILCNVAGMLLFDIFGHFSGLVIPDVVVPTSILSFLVLTPLFLAMIPLMRRRLLSATHGSTIFLFLIIGTMLGMMLLSRAPSAILLAFIIPMVTVHSSIALPLPVAQAATVAAGAAILTTVAVVLHPGFDLGSGLYAVTLNVSMAGYLTVATLRNEINERRFYLLTLRDTLRSERLLARNRTLLSLSGTDGLTGVGNRRAFDATLEDLWRDGAKAGSAIALMMIDIDCFKRLNDTHGHLGGDVCLRAVASLIGPATGSAAATFRYGGEEFAILLSGSEAGQVALLAERVRVAVASACIPVPNGPPGGIGLTVSIGCAALVPDPGLPHATLIAIADAALYRAKQTGRNRVQVGTSGSVPSRQVA
ncbi:GGDEF domain-containing protein [Methylobacterium sp. 77]|uniref:GGDEF domain-containing protein n=1 Tax=Methylobacterium sp. 77 TaxID=1101192 RepID=UPI00037DD765|nr:GGDEF domain-containing protein [Methylobacterium sp. 77]